MDKKEALTRLNSLEHEAKELRKIIEKADEPKPVTERVKTFTDACKELGINPCQITNNTLDSKDEVAFKKLKIIAKALNEGWTPNRMDTNQYKHYPYFDYSSSSLVYYCYYFRTNDEVPLALTFKNKELAIYAGKQFINEYNEYLNNI